MLEGMIIRVSCRVKDLQKEIERAWTKADAMRYPHA